MSINLLDRNNNTAILLAGIIGLIVGVGVARFAFTSLLPAMLDDSLELTFAGVLASMNFVGYLSGAIFAIFIKDINAKVKYFRIGMVLCVLTTLSLGLTTNETVWLIARIIAGFGAAMALVVGSAIVMTKLNFEDKTKAMGIHFSGIGFSILVTDLMSRAVLVSGENWQTAWLVLTFLGTILAVYAIYILSFDHEIKQNNVTHSLDKSLFSVFVIVLILAYFTEGVGFVVQGTFLPDIINSLQGLEGYGSFTWTMVGLAGIPSCIIWMRLAARYGSVNMIMIAMLIQVIGILIPTLTNNVYLNLFCGVLYGGTFVGLVALFMHLGGKLGGQHPVMLMGALTAAYGIGQVTAPLYSVALVHYSGSYDYALYLTAAIVFSGVVMLFFAKNLQHAEQL
ncbi:YbfB/YjiJ family MFS transporter [Candidatus Albibeggiatoa sp. nov. NOAA]|uniref:YbfB/YjiJ family MFS transporter n=1 Tax=Candidatus Albibeggiatoa sp. nov. NOAA TaxID=3162724 RepID=UPI0033046722|nr:YbfB/YjiJ family MFS transporter [Thiotrichaceae bacterium]